MTPSPNNKFPFSFDAHRAIQDGRTEDQVLDYVNKTYKFDTDSALKSGYTKRQLIDAMSGYTRLETEVRQEGRKVTDTLIDLIRPFAAGTAGAAAGAYSGPAAGFTAPAAYLTMDTLMQKLKSKDDQSFASQMLGFEEGGLASSLTNTLEQGLVGKTLEKAGIAGLRGVRTLRNADQPEIYNYLPTTSQAAKAQGFNKLGGITKVMEDLNISNKEAALDRAGGVGFTQALRTAKDADLIFHRNPNEIMRLLEDVMPLGEGSYTPIKIKLGQTYKPKAKGSLFQPQTPGEVIAGEPKINNLLESFSRLDSTIKDPIQLEKVLTQGQINGVGDNLKRTLGGYQFMKIFNEASERSLSGPGGKMTGSVTRINPAKLENAWLDPEMQDSLKLLYNSKQRADIEQFFKNISFTQDKVHPMPVAKNLWLMGGAFNLGMGLFSGNMASVKTGLSGLAVVLTPQVFSKLLTNPKTARFMVAMAGGEPLGVGTERVGRAISQVLQGSVVSILNSDETTTPVIVEDQKFVPLDHKE